LTGSAAVFLIGTFVAGAVLRAIVYFRNGYRAANYGAADLIEIIRQIDRAIMESAERSNENNSVQLSFIGHSMGGFVVTSAIRSLTDLFAGMRSDRTSTLVLLMRTCRRFRRIGQGLPAQPIRAGLAGHSCRDSFVQPSELSGSVAAPVP
jgi:Putative serine esterase (DUF676)